ncbi:hypothetical protein HYDPIDRAFT_39013 [Hydnomerulius pinastri MD-312]|nr:hypothetical protein HYDPIDRAFT_39013 [Hydnomerulius pinastri MD-312]
MGRLPNGLGGGSKALKHPPGLPIVGNMFDISPSEPWVSHMQLGEKYGDIVHFIEHCESVLEQLSHNYLNRLHVAVNKLDVAFSDEWRLHRKIYRHALRPEAVVSYRPMHLRRSRELAKNMFESPQDYLDHLVTYSIAFSMSATYDYDPAPRDDPVVTKIKTDATADVIDRLTKPPVLHVPTWFLGAALQRRVATMRKMVDWWLTDPFNYVQRAIHEGMAAPSLVRNALARVDTEREDAEVLMGAIKATAAGSFAAGAEMTDSTLRIFLLAMTMYPNVQKCAQEEIASVVGSERLPDFTNRPNLPYLEAVLRETMR